MQSQNDLFFKITLMRLKLNKALVTLDNKLARNANTDNMGKLFVTVFAFAPAH